MRHRLPVRYANQAGLARMGDAKCASTQTPNSAKMACVDLPEDKPVWKEEWFWGAMSCVGGAMAVGLSTLAYKKNKAREDPEVQTSEQSVVITKTSKKLVL